MTRTTRTLSLLATLVALAVSAPLAQAADDPARQAATAGIDRVSPGAIAPNPACFRCYVVVAERSASGRFVPRGLRWSRAAS